MGKVAIIQEKTLEDIATSIRQAYNNDEYHNTFNPAMHISDKYKPSEMPEVIENIPNISYAPTGVGFDNFEENADLTYETRCLDTTNIKRGSIIFSSSINKRKKIKRIDVSEWNYKQLDITNMFEGMTNLDDYSLQSIVTMLYNNWIRYLRVYESLKRMGLTEEQANKCTKCKYWDTVSDEDNGAGVKTGYET